MPLGARYSFSSGRALRLDDRQDERAQRHLDGALRRHLYVLSLASARLGTRDSQARCRDTGMVLAHSCVVEVHGERMMDWIRSDKQWQTMALVVESQWGLQNDDDGVLMDLEGTAVFEEVTRTPRRLFPER
jgi:hypothetical protein